MEEKIIYDFQLNNIEETLRLIGNQINSKDRSSCLARMVEQSKRFIENSKNNQPSTYVSYDGYNEQK